MRAPCPADDTLIRFGVVTDLHFSHAPPAMGRYYADSLDKLRAAIACLNGIGLDLLINLGDLVDHEIERADEPAAVAAVGAALAAFDGPRLHVLGNHDLASFSKARFLGMLPDAVPGPYYSVDQGEVKLVVLDGNCRADGSDFEEGNFAWDDAWVGPPQVDWLREELADGTPAIVFCHEILEPWGEGSGKRDPHVAGNAAVVRAAMAEAGNVRLVVQGHCHGGAAGVAGGIPYLTLQAMVTGPGLENNAFSAIRVGRDGSVTVRGFGRQPGWRFTPGGTGWSAAPGEAIF